MTEKLEENKFNGDYTYDAIVVGAGHAGIESGLALSKMGCKTLMLSITLDNIGYLACNPSIGGTAKGHLVREIDALGGEMGIAADKCLTQLRMLNSSKGPAVHSLRAQVDKYKYHDYMKSLLENTPNLTLRQGEVKSILYSDSKVDGILTVLNQKYYAPVVVLACGVYLSSSIIVGDVIENKGPVCFARSNYLSAALSKMGIEVRRFKTGTPARIKLDSVDLSKLEVQQGEDTPYSFSQTSKKINKKGRACYLGYTNPETHELIKQSIHLSPKYSGLIHGAGARYCPSIEDKIVRFADKERHQFFLEPEGEGTQEMYVQGISTGLPADVQLPLYRTISGFENVHIMRDAYAIEYDCINSTELYPTLMHKTFDGLFFAGQINGTSGYEEAAAQGLVAGINGALKIKGQEPMILTRDNSYIGVLIDDLVTVGTNEPYRMMTSRAEYRLLLRQDNADRRLTPIGIKVGLADKKRATLFKKKQAMFSKAKQLLAATLLPSDVEAMFAEAGESLPYSGIKVLDIIKRVGITAEIFLKHCNIFKDLRTDCVAELFTEIKYEGYLSREKKAVAEKQRVEHAPLPIKYDYSNFPGIRQEAREKLNKFQPLTIGQASRISGVTPADVNILIFNFVKR